MHDSEETTIYFVASMNHEWVNAMKSELTSIEKNENWSMVELPLGMKPIGLKWVFKLKRDPNGKVSKQKARLVAKGYVQKQGIEFYEVFTPVARMETIWILHALSATNRCLVHHLDVKLTFLYEDLEEEEVYFT